MCRLLCIRGRAPFEIRPHLETFAGIARDSREYQGHGWGCAWLTDDGFEHYHNIKPVWEDKKRDFGATRLFLAHARSAFKDEGIRVENNMPFGDDEHVFIFNGELRGVRIKEAGRIGAEKIFNYIKRFDKGNTLEALERALGVIKKRTRYIRALNLIMASRNCVFAASHFSEDPDYFQMHTMDKNGLAIICSQAYPDEQGWQRFANRAVTAFPLEDSR